MPKWPPRQYVKCLMGCEGTGWDARHLSLWDDTEGQGIEQTYSAPNIEGQFDDASQDPTNPCFWSNDMVGHETRNDQATLQSILGKFCNISEHECPDHPPITQALENIGIAHFENQFVSLLDSAFFQLKYPNPNYDLHNGSEPLIDLQHYHKIALHVLKAAFSTLR